MKGKMFSLLGLVVGLALIFSSFSSVNAEGLKTISAKALDDHECDATEWHFVITQIESADMAPSSIHVTWANGASEDVPLDKYTGKTAHYSTTSNLTSTVVGATAQIYDAWSGQFNLSHGPCGVNTTPTPPVDETLTPTPPVDETLTPTPPVETVTPTVTNTPPVEETATPTVTGTPPVEETATPTATVVVTGTPPVEQTATPTEPVEPTSTPKPHDTGSGSNVPWTLPVGGLLVGLSLLGLFWSKK